jgi:phosphoheptose isomerase
MSSVDEIPSICQPGREAANPFPATSYASAGAYFRAYEQQAALAIMSVDPAALDGAADILIDAYTRGANVFTCGNGGSATIANHLVCDHVKGIRNATDLTPRVISLSSNVELITAIANDLTYQDIFTYQLESRAQPGDVLFVVSSSGRSPNIVRALTWAREHDVRTIAMTGFDGGDARKIADVTVHADCENYGIVEDLHQALMHALAQYIRQSRMTASAILTNVF